MNDKYNFQRFINAQLEIYENVLSELKNGKKISHWMWFIFPQYRGLGVSEISRKYSLNNTEEAISYLNHPILGLRLMQCTATFLSIENKSAIEILGETDSLKLKSSMTLFDSIQNETNLFNSVLQRFYDGKRCLLTIDLLKNEK